MCLRRAAAVREPAAASRDLHSSMVKKEIQARFGLAEAKLRVI